jgi:hypothetical protein
MAKPVSIPNTFAAVTTASTVNLDADFTTLANAINDPLTYAVYAPDSGAVNVYTVTLNPAPAAQANLLGVPLAWKANTPNTGSSNLNVNALGAQSIVRPGGAALIAGDIFGTVITVWDGTNYVLQTARDSFAPRDYISGFALTNNGTTGFDVAAGFANNSTNVAMITGAAIANKTQVAWAAGTGNGGKLSAAAMASNTWYYWYALRKDVDATVDYGFDVSPTSPTMPAGYTYFRYIGGRKTQAASTNWDTFIQHGDEVYWSTPPALDVNTTNPGTAAVTATINVPAVKVRAFLNVGFSNNTPITAVVYFSDLAVADVAASTTATPLGSAAVTASGIGSVISSQVSVWTNTSSQIRYRAGASDANFTIRIVAIGWLDPRGRPV